MSTSTETVESKFVALYAAFNSRDLDGVLASLAPDVDWPASTEGGRAYGHEAVRGYWTRQWQSIDPKVDPVRIVQGEDGRIVVDVHQVVHDRAGVLLVDGMVQHVYSLRDGLVTHMEIRQLGPPA